MSRVVQVTAGRLARSTAVVVAIVAALFLVFGVVLVLGTDSGEEDLELLKLGFLAIWVVVCLGMIFLSVRVAARPSDPGSVSIFQLQEQDGDAQASSPSGQETSFDVRLRKLAALHKDGLISETEYQTKRSEIMREKW